MPTVTESTRGTNDPCSTSLTRCFFSILDHTYVRLCVSRFRLLNEQLVICNFETLEVLLQRAEVRLPRDLGAFIPEPRRPHPPPRPSTRDLYEVPALCGARRATHAGYSINTDANLVVRTSTSMWIYITNMQNSQLLCDTIALGRIMCVAKECQLVVPLRIMQRWEFIISSQCENVSYLKSVEKETERTSDSQCTFITLEKQ